MNQRRLGVSVYPDHSDLKQDQNYLEKASSLGFTRIFMSMLEINGDSKAVVDKYKSIIGFAKDLNYEIILDVSPAIFDTLKISYDDLQFFKDLGADGIRLDNGFDGAKEALLTFNPQNLIIEINMSNDVAYLNNILSYEANIPFLYGCHNFYPQKGTGLPSSFFEKCGRRFKSQNIHTAAFISSSVGQIGPWDVNDGLPTLEFDRELPLDIQAKHLFATGLIDDVIIGNAYASKAELEKLSNIDRYQVEFTIETTENNNRVENQILFDNQHVRRGDINEMTIRSTQVRKKYEAEKNLPHDHNQTFERGDVVIGNDTFGKYKNELQVILEPHADPRKNKVGRIIEDELFLLDFIRPWSKFKFVNLND
ncbi:DUF871 domain-containing protein [Xylocopilactobacillus apicola]|uniref:DUF871 domain-containing protein n=1 Tax=Xylocopilactobacillus apicola TaxID=2932184 RepID=A0AAU9D397_9LACO|nr:MupG family TIM beta-alpha barrel fold protein [Xylocopilactobacillus apicola]BDR58254.1 hypothetical protein XA3_06950 [Xylocopilactobacillus apicola]